MAIQTKKPDEKLYESLKEKLAKELENKRLNTCAIDLSMGDEECGAYLTVVYDLEDFFGRDSNFNPDSIIYDAVKRVFGEYFEESGSGAGLGRRDIGFAEKDKWFKQRLQST